MPITQQAEKDLLDLLIIGAGPAGIACALQAKRDGLRIELLSDEPVGGLLPAARRIDNLPGLPGISGAELAARLQAQLGDAQVPWESQQVTGLMRSSEGFVARCDSGREIQARCLCLATGSRPRPWTDFELPEGVHRDLRSLPEDLRGRSTVVVGGGEAALDTALSLRERGAAVQVWLRTGSPRACAALLQEARAARIRFCAGRNLSGVKGRPSAWLLIDGRGISHAAAELVISIGRQANEYLLREVPGYAPGLFMAGDLIRGRERYIATAMGDGQGAALAAGQYLRGEKER